MKISDALDRGIDFLGAYEGSRLDCEVLLAFVIGKSLEYVLAHHDDVYDKFDKYWELVEKRGKGMSIAYLTGVKEFYGLDFFVDERVLIPRPETEMIVDEVLKMKRGCRRILDIGTGSGAIVVAVTKNLPDASAVATDISESALEVARINALKHEVSDRIEFIQSDLLDNVSDSFDVICANLPYIGDNDFVDENVKRYEPSIALFQRGELYKKLFQQLKKGVVDFKTVIGEFGFGQHDYMAGLLSKYFDQKWKIKKDLNGISRIFIVSV